MAKLLELKSPSYKGFHLYLVNVNFNERNFLQKHTTMLFHGTKKENLKGILDNGIEPTINGAVDGNGDHYGVGVYLTQNISIANQYGDCVLVYEVDLKELELTNDVDEFIVVETRNILVPRFLYMVIDDNNLNFNDMTFYTETLNLLNSVKKHNNLQPKVHDIGSIPLDYFKTKRRIVSDYAPDEDLDKELDDDIIETYEEEIQKLFNLF